MEFVFKYAISLETFIKLIAALKGINIPYKEKIKPGEPTCRGGKIPMMPMPRLIVQAIHSEIKAESIELDQARYFAYDSDILIAVEGVVVHSYKELLNLASQEPYKSKIFLKVELIGILSGG